ncbi:MAG: DUF4260 domain-containing protein [Chloroflexota bacterium]
MINQTLTEQSSRQHTFSLPRILLSVEGLAVFVASLVLYHLQGGNWWLFFGLLLFPDLAFIPYMLDKRIGTIAYNLVHTYSVPTVLGVIALLTNWQFGIWLAIIWFAHISMDRTVGYGLKYQTAFKDTHLQRATARS